MKIQDDYRIENDNLRELFKTTYPDISKIKQADINRLLWLLDEELDKHFQAGFLKMYMLPVNILTAKMIREKGIQHKGLELKVGANYFPQGREGIHFFPDGRVYFCGWAGGTNHEPFQRGFRKWLETAGAYNTLLKLTTLQVAT